MHHGIFTIASALHWCVWIFFYTVYGVDTFVGVFEPFQSMHGSVFRFVYVSANSVCLLYRSAKKVLQNLQLCFLWLWFNYSEFHCARRLSKCQDLNLSRTTFWGKKQWLHVSGKLKSHECRPLATSVQIMQETCIAFGLLRCGSRKATNTNIRNIAKLEVFRFGLGGWWDLSFKSIDVGKVLLSASVLWGWCNFAQTNPKNNVMLCLWVHWCICV